VGPRVSISNTAGGFPDLGVQIGKGTAFPVSVLVSVDLSSHGRIGQHLTEQNIAEGRKHRRFAGAGSIRHFRANRPKLILSPLRQFFHPDFRRIWIRFAGHAEPKPGVLPADSTAA
jgi:hypothetical protein